jgi:hypothetical protein
MYLILTERYSLTALDNERRVGQLVKNRFQKEKLLLEPAILEGGVPSLLDGYRSLARSVLRHQRRAKVNEIVARSLSSLNFGAVQSRRALIPVTNMK